MCVEELLFWKNICSYVIHAQTHSHVRHDRTDMLNIRRMWQFVYTIQRSKGTVLAPDGPWRALMPTGSAHSHPCLPALMGDAG